MPNRTTEDRYLTEAERELYNARVEREPKDRIRRVLNALSLINSMTGAAAGVSDDFIARTLYFEDYYQAAEDRLRSAYGIPSTIEI